MHPAALRAASRQMVASAAAAGQEGVQLSGLENRLQGEARLGQDIYRLGCFMRMCQSRFYAFRSCVRLFHDMWQHVMCNMWQHGLHVPCPSLHLVNLYLVSLPR